MSRKPLGASLATRLGSVVLAAGTALTISACGGPAHTTGSSQLSSAATASASASPSPSAKPLTGTQLKALLLRNIRSGFKPDASATSDSGNDLEQPSVGPIEPKSKCADLNTTAFVETTGIGEIAFAQAGYVNSKQDQIYQELDSYSPGTGTKVLARMRQVIAQCARFTDKSQGSSVSEQVKSVNVSGIGDEVIEAKIISPAYQGGTTFVMTRVGDIVACAVYNDTEGSYDDGHIADVAKHLVASVRAAGA